MISRQVVRALAASAGVVLGLAWPATSQASVVIASTRVIYDAQESEVTLKLTNEGTAPALVQTWIDKGDARAAPSTIEVPFTVVPPIARIDPTKGQTLRIAYTGEALPQDKESVFWLNVLEVPPKPTGDAADANQMQLAFRSRIKVFFRPSGLKGSSEDAPALVVWRLYCSTGPCRLEASNPTAYHVSFTSIDVSAGDKVATFDEGAMVGPGEREVLPLKGVFTPAAGARVHYSALNDFGGPVAGDAALQPGDVGPLSK
jgi:chaperone protein EcpD